MVGFYNELQLGPLTESSLTVDRVEVQWGVCSPSVVEVEEKGDGVEGLGMEEGGETGWDVI